MKGSVKNQKDILQKLNIDQLNPMQEEAMLAISTCEEVVLLSPTGSGKTLAFLLPLLPLLDRSLEEVQLMILVPARELAIQIEQVTREMGTGFKCNAVYGGRTVSKDKLDLKQPPAILIGTPGRVADHLRRGTFSKDNIRHLVLDEFDKALEIGFEDDMAEIIGSLDGLEKKILTSATFAQEIPSFVGLMRPAFVNYLDEGGAKLRLRRIVSPDKDKLETLFKALCHLGNHPGIVFCNYKDSIERISDYLNEHDIDHGVYYGGLEQKERERALLKFRNGTYQLLLTTDLAARGIDIPEIAYIIHYHLPQRSQEFTHRNGRTARMHAEGSAYVLHAAGETLPDLIPDVPEEELTEAPVPESSPWKTLFVSGGRRDKISKGDIAGLFFKQGQLKPEHIGQIELKQDCAFVAVQASKAITLIKLLSGSKLKKKKVKITLI